uniref:Cyclic nucleotide-binding domain-containing protein n=1 Tax=Chromera velia CCMP2878 TaxID=1169474 RepID=A0A0G4G8T8_9ALVE|eukprot:Cvel_20753.t1-p1 / transcript=Cvel_20753.t1 / gene=Cvel_20753 / organism=Chromera_velia_CCMP2878 / gene_product=Cyclic nucleotide-gated channel cone photoreceptor, putative / transcript_product=Cyclic nucleotide-gated channel cone photoreceptor, putative / location=Cvel_scaffold1891:17560-24857(-) / protein_length=962 / sequence_SO=supercontig / SO=protein_coding / is_pseudo=false
MTAISEDIRPSSPGGAEEVDLEAPSRNRQRAFTGGSKRNPTLPKGSVSFYDNGKALIRELSERGGDSPAVVPGRLHDGRGSPGGAYFENPLLGNGLEEDAVSVGGFGDDFEGVGATEMTIGARERRMSIGVLKRASVEEGYDEDLDQLFKAKEAQKRHHSLGGLSRGTSAIEREAAAATAAIVSAADYVPVQPNAHEDHDHFQKPMAQWILHRTSPWFYIWHVLLSAAVLFYIVMAPISLAFEVNLYRWPGFLGVDLAAFCVYALDIPLRLVSFFQELSSQTGVLRNSGVVANLVCVYLLMCHVIACLFMIVARRYGVEPWNGESFDSLSVPEKYALSFYFGVVIASSAPLGEVVPLTTGEKATALVLITLTKLFFAFVYAQVASVMSRMNSAAIAHMRERADLQTWIKHVQLPPELSKRIDTHLDMLWKYNKGTYEAKVLRKLPEPIRHNVAQLLYAASLEKVSIFSGTDDLISALAVHLKPFVLAEGEWMMRQGDIANEMFIILQGEVEVLVGPAETRVALLGPNSFVGEMSLIELEDGSALSRVRTASVRALGNVRACKLERRDFAQVLVLYPNTAVSMRKIAMERLEAVQNAAKDATEDAGSSVSDSSGDFDPESSRQIELDASELKTLFDVTPSVGDSCSVADPSLGSPIGRAMRRSVSVMQSRSPLSPTADRRRLKSHSLNSVAPLLDARLSAAWARGKFGPSGDDKEKEKNNIIEEEPQGMERENEASPLERASEDMKGQSEQGGTRGAPSAAASSRQVKLQLRSDDLTASEKDLRSKLYPPTEGGEDGEEKEKKEKEKEKEEECQRTPSRASGGGGGSLATTEREREAAAAAKEEALAKRNVWTRLKTFFCSRRVLFGLLAGFHAIFGGGIQLWMAPLQVAFLSPYTGAYLLLEILFLLIYTTASCLEFALWRCVCKGVQQSLKEWQQTAQVGRQNTQKASCTNSQDKFWTIAG